MITFEKQTQTVEVEVTSKVTCNRCGYEVQYVRKSLDLNQFHSFNATFKFGSTLEGQTWGFELCDSCVQEIASRFVHSPDIRNRW